jgi:hypothetical protein
VDNRLPLVDSSNPSGVSGISSTTTGSGVAAIVPDSGFAARTTFLVPHRQRTSESPVKQNHCSSISAMK